MEILKSIFLSWGYSLYQLSKFIYSNQIFIEEKPSTFLPRVINFNEMNSVSGKDDAQTC